MLNGYEIYVNTTNCRIFNMQYSRYWLCTSFMDCFSLLLSISVVGWSGSTTIVLVNEGIGLILVIQKIYHSSLHIISALNAFSLYCYYGLYFIYIHLLTLQWSTLSLLLAPNYLDLSYTTCYNGIWQIHSYSYIHSQFCF